MVTDDFTDEGSTILLNLDNYLPLNIMQQPKQPASSRTML